MPEGQTAPCLTLRCSLEAIGLLAAVQRHQGGDKGNRKERITEGIG